MNETESKQTFSAILNDRNFEVVRLEDENTAQQIDLALSPSPVLINPIGIGSVHGFRNWSMQAEFNNIHFFVPQNADECVALASEPAENGFILLDFKIKRCSK